MWLTNHQDSAAEGGPDIDFLKTLTNIDELLEGGGENADWLDGVNMATTMLHAEKYFGPSCSLN